MTTTIPAGYTKLNYTPVTHEGIAMTPGEGIDSKNQIVTYIDGEWYGRPAVDETLDLRDVIITVDGLNRVDFQTTATGCGWLPRLTLTFSGDAGPENRLKGIRAFLDNLQVVPHANLSLNEVYLDVAEAGLKIVDEGITDFLTALTMPGYFHTHFLNENTACLNVTAMLVESVILDNNDHDQPE